MRLFLVLLVASGVALVIFKERALALEKVGEIHVRGLKQQELFELVDRYESENRILVLLPGKEERYSLKELGVELDKGELWFGRNEISNLWSSWTPKIRVSRSYLLVEPNLPEEVKVTFNELTGLFELKNRKQIYKVEMKQIVDEVVKEYGKAEIKVAPEFAMIEDKGLAYLTVNESLKQVYNSPLVLKVKDGASFVDFFIPKEKLISAMKKEVLYTNKLVELDKNVLLADVIANLSSNQKKYFDDQLAYENLKGEVGRRFQEGKVSEAVLGIDDGSTTNGSLAEKYLEVDISQQKMYLFIGNKIYKEYKVSTGNYYPTPIGQYKILNKAPKAYSAIFGVWMPYWMAFEYAEDIEAYLGIHELPYVLGSAGEQIYRFGYYIGNKMTGGCVAMEPKDSKEVYDLSEVGMIVNVVP